MKESIWICSIYMKFKINLSEVKRVDFPWGQINDRKKAREDVSNASDVQLLWAWVTQVSLFCEC